jgi:hypothetical protein
MTHILSNNITLMQISIELLSSKIRLKLNIMDDFIIILEEERMHNLCRSHIAATFCLYIIVIGSSYENIHSCLYSHVLIEVYTNVVCIHFKWKKSFT